MKTLKIEHKIQSESLNLSPISFEISKLGFHCAGFQSNPRSEFLSRVSNVGLNCCWNLIAQEIEKKKKKSIADHLRRTGHRVRVLIQTLNQVKNFSKRNLEEQEKPKYIKSQINLGKAYLRRRERLCADQTRGERGWEQIKSEPLIHFTERERNRSESGREREWKRVTKGTGSGPGILNLDGNLDGLGPDRPGLYGPIICLYFDSKSKCFLLLQI